MDRDHLSFNHFLTFSHVTHSLIGLLMIVFRFVMMEEDIREFG